MSSGGFSKSGAQGEDMYGARLIRSLKENGEKKCRGEPGRLKHFSVKKSFSKMTLRIQIILSCDQQLTCVVHMLDDRAAF